MALVPSQPDDMLVETNDGVFVNGSGERVTSTGPHALDPMSTLKARAKELDVKGRTRMTHAELAEAVTAAEAPTGTPPPMTLGQELVQNQEGS